MSEGIQIARSAFLGIGIGGFIAIFVLFAEMFPFTAGFVFGVNVTLGIAFCVFAPSQPH